MRNLFERAIPAAGFHVTEGNRIWEGYREFEQGILDTIDKADLEVGFIFLMLRGINRYKGFEAYFTVTCLFR
ncbi:hypothetical protein F2Q69_00034109 [Brassica cretica]|uniref:Uncharacterized protein n=1 Tax=Brassica cretica TaxID=69181 RepID=A0A8S9SHS1_BRACR|nr:hypothetical protein F2Q69_00034109 [Brassica cretica]